MSGHGGSEYVSATAPTTADAEIKHVAPEAERTVDNADSHSRLDSATSQHATPMAATGSQAAQSEFKSREVTADHDAANGSNAISYGTRSRHRTNGARPNYAEDKDMDIDADTNNTTQKESSMKKGSAPQAIGVASEEEVVHNVSTRRSGGFAAVNGNGSTAPHTAQAQQRDSLPGMSSFASLSTSTQPSTTSRKRKQPGGAAATAAPAASSSQPSSRLRGSYSSAVPESNMMSFEKSGAILKNGKLKADDGTVLSINGECLPSV